MFSVFILYSSDRIRQLKITLACLREMSGYGACEKILVVDGTTNIRPPEFKVVEVSRPGEDFNWSRAWRAGVDACSRERILYLDSDRILPRNYLLTLCAALEPGAFAFTSDHRMFRRDLDLWEVRRVRENPDAYGHLYYREERLAAPVEGERKNVMSGNTAFFRSTFEQSGGVDPWYAGGGWADCDYHRQCHVMGFRFTNIAATELHLRHPPRPITPEKFERNRRYYFRKWGIYPVT